MVFKLPLTFYFSGFSILATLDIFNTLFMYSQKTTSFHINLLPRLLIELSEHLQIKSLICTFISEDCPGIT